MLQSCLTRWAPIPGTSHMRALPTSLASMSQGCCLPNLISNSTLTIRNSRDQVSLVLAGRQIHALQSCRTHKRIRPSDLPVNMHGISAINIHNYVRREMQYRFNPRALESATSTPATIRTTSPVLKTSYSNIVLSKVILIPTRRDQLHADRKSVV